jgi:hypothetical protein
VNSPNVTELSTGKQSGVAAQTFDQWRTRLAVDAAMTMLKHTGNIGHNIKFGYEFFRGLSDAKTDVFQAINLNVLNAQASSVTEYNTPLDEIEEFRGSVVHAQDNVSLGKVTLNLGLRFEHTAGILPAQGASGGPFSAPRSFPEQTLFTWNTLAPRLGVIYDPLPEHNLALKAGYSRYYHAASTGYVSGANQNNLGGTGFDWVDKNHDGKFQPGEEGDKLFAFGGSITSIDPNLKQPLTDEFAAGVEFEAPYKIRVTGQYIHRHAKDLLAIVEIGVPFTTGYVPVTAIDPVTGGHVTLYNQLPQYLGANKQLETNPSDFTTNFNGFEITAQRRFSQGYQFLASYAYSTSDITRTSISVSQYGGEEEGAGGVGFSNGSAFLNPNQLINNTSGPGFYDRTNVFKVGGSYDWARPGVTVAALAKIQTGTPYNRILTLQSAANGVDFNQGPITFFADPRGSFRYPTLKVMDFRVSKFFLYGRNRFEVIGDFFNLFNVSTVTGVNPNSGSDFGKPTDILGPRVFRIGGRWTF